MVDPFWMLSAAALLTLLGFAWLALAMDTHWEQVHGREGPVRGTQRLLRWLGSAALLLSFLCCLRADHASMAVLVWAMLLAGAAVAVAMTLSWRPTLLRAAWPRG